MVRVLKFYMNVGYEIISVKQCIFNLYVYVWLFIFGLMYVMMFIEVVWDVVYEIFNYETVFVRRLVKLEINFYKIISDLILQILF